MPPKVTDEDASSSGASDGNRGPSPAPIEPAANALEVVGELDHTPSWSSRAAVWMLSTMERVLFGNSSYDAPQSVNTQAAQLSIHREVTPSQHSLSPNTRGPPHEPFSKVIIEEPHGAWMRRHAHRIAREQCREQNISRFSQALAQRESSASPEGAGVSNHRTLSGMLECAGGVGSCDNPEWVSLSASMTAYQRFPNMFYGSLVEAALATRGPDFPVTGEELRCAVGNEFLVTAILASGSIDTQDPEVTRFVQREIDTVICPMHHDGNAQNEEEAGKACSRVNPKFAGYLRALLQLPTSRISAAQLKLLERSGFEFLQIIHDHPHILSDLPRSSWWKPSAYNSHGTFDLVAAVVAMLLICMDLGCIAALAINWLDYPSRSKFGYWTLLMALGGYVFTFIVVVVFESSKVNSSMYQEQLWEYPSSNVRVVPMVPILEGMILVNIIRYYFAARRGNKQSYFVVTHDLYASFSQLFVLHSQCHSFPQILLQSYLMWWGNFDTGQEGFPAFRLLLVTASMSVILAALMFLRRISFYRSVNALGFAVFGSSADARFDSPRNFFPQIITYLLIFMLEYNSFFLITAVTNDITKCHTSVLVWIGIMGGIVLTVIVILVLSIARGKSSSITARLSLAPLLGQVAFAVYASLFNSTETSDSVSAAESQSITAACAFYSISLGANVRVGIATFVVLIAVWCLWIATTCWKRYLKVKHRSDLTLCEKVKYVVAHIKKQNGCQTEVTPQLEMTRVDAEMREKTATETREPLVLG